MKNLLKKSVQQTKKSVQPSNISAVPAKAEDKTELGGLSQHRRQEMEKNAHNQIARFDKHFNDRNTAVTLDKMTTSRDGSIKKRFVISQNGKEKYEAKFVENNGRQKLEQLVSIKRTEQK